MVTVRLPDGSRLDISIGRYNSEETRYAGRPTPPVGLRLWRAADPYAR